MSSSENKQLRVAATFIVFVVLMIQTLLLKMNFDLRPESTMLVFYGFVASDVISVCTWLFYSKD